MREVAENEGTVQICTTLVNDPAFAVIARPIAVTLVTSDDTGKEIRVVSFCSKIY